MVPERDVEVLHALVELLHLLELQVRQLLDHLQRPYQLAHGAGLYLDVDEHQTIEGDLGRLVLQTIDQEFEVGFGLDVPQDELLASLVVKPQELDGEVQLEEVLVLKAKLGRVIAVELAT